MKEFLALALTEVKTPVVDLVTKFGGQPVWLQSPQWPISKELCTPMMFIGQVLLDPRIFRSASASMAYLFMTDDISGDLPTMDPLGGENAVILQPGKIDVPVQEVANGPSLIGWTGGWRRYHVGPVEYLATASPKRCVGDDGERSRLVGNKVGGEPAWIYEPELPEGDSWHLLLQLEPNAPIDLGLGDIGVLYAMINTSGDRAIMLWQTH